mgnify:CR=1 FL=1
MITINARTKERLTKGVRKFQPILSRAKTADINESDTVTIVTDMLCEIFGYDKYENVTSEFAVKKTFCDLAIKLNDKVQFLIECKAIGLDLKDDFIRQATNYAADYGVDWVVLTNGAEWRIYKISFTKPIEKEMVYAFNIIDINTKKQSDLEMLYYLCVEAFSKASKATLDDLLSQKQIMNRFVLGQIILSDPVIDAIRKRLRKLCPDIKTSNEEIHDIVISEIVKREIIEGEDSDDARKKLQKLERALAKAEEKPVDSNVESEGGETL